MMTLVEKNRLVLALAAMCIAASGCAAPAATLTPSPVPEPQVAEAAHEAGDEAQPLRFETLYEGAVRTDSLHVVARDGAALVGFDTLEGEVWLGAWRKVAERAQLGCLAVDGAGTVFVGTLERAALAPTSELVVRRFAGDALEPLGEPWRPSAPALWPEPGARCAFVATGDPAAPFAIVARARAAQAGSALDLWFSPLDGDGAAQPFTVGTRVPAILASVTFDDGALLVTETVVDHERDGERGRTHAYGLLHVDARGERTPLASGAPLTSPLAVALEERTAVVSWVESGRHVPVELMQPPHASVLTRVVPRQLEAPSIDEAQVLRTDVYDPVARDQAARPLFVEGRWWALLVPERYTERGESEPAPYRERLVALDEGPATVRLLPEGVYGVQAAGSAGLVALGAPDADNPGHSSGVFVSTGTIEVADLEVR